MKMKFPEGIHIFSETPANLSYGILKVFGVSYGTPATLRTDTEAAPHSVPRVAFRGTFCDGLQSQSAPRSASHGYETAVPD